MRVTRLVFPLSAALLLAAGLSAQPKPDFSGTWTIVTPQEGAPAVLVIKQDATSVSESDGEGDTAHTVTAKLDGTESRTTLPSHDSEIVIISTATWKGESLVVTSNATYPAGNKRQVVRTWTLDAQNQLHIDVTMAPNTPQARNVKAVYKKK